MPAFRLVGKLDDPDPELEMMTVPPEPEELG
jgi:hypothetical protein